MMLERYLRTLVEAGGSDLHLRAGSPPRVRVNGELAPIPEAPVLTDEDTRAIAASIADPRTLARFESGDEVDLAYAVGQQRFRVNIYRQRNTVAIVFRLVVAEPATIEELRLPTIVRSFADEQRGLVIVAGPTGAGKTTTLAAMVDHINRARPAHIVTIEDPIEVIHVDRRASISQRELGADTPSFASAMRAALRQDPDVILIGEMRDVATVEAALMAAETGHLVLSTLHTTDASETITRIVEFFPSHQQRQARLLLAGVLRGTVCQRLLPRKGDAAGLAMATEVMVVNGRVQQWIVDPAVREGVQDIIADGDYYGMHAFDQSILALYRRGEVDLETALAHASNPHDLSVEIRRTEPASPRSGPPRVPRVVPPPAPAPAPPPVPAPQVHDVITTLSAQLPPPEPVPARRRRGFWARFRRDGDMPLGPPAQPKP